MQGYKSLFLTAAFLFLCSLELIAQNHHETIREHKFRAAVLMGHTLVSLDHSDDHLFIPSWGLDVEYWPLKKWGLGLHSDIELESFIIINGDNEAVERINPLVMTLDVLYRPWKGLVLGAGPGIELEQSDHYELFRVSLEYEVELGNHFDFCPSIFYDQRFDGYSTFSIALGVGKRF